jgi:hypothetical protein
LTEKIRCPNNSKAIKEMVFLIKYILPKKAQADYLINEIKHLKKENKNPAKKVFSSGMLKHV